MIQLSLPAAGEAALAAREAGHRRGGLGWAAAPPVLSRSAGARPYFSSFYSHLILPVPWQSRRGSSSLLYGVGPVKATGVKNGHGLFCPNCAAARCFLLRAGPAASDCTGVPVGFNPACRSDRPRAIYSTHVATFPVPCYCPAVFEIN